MDNKNRIQNIIRLANKNNRIQKYSDFVLKEEAKEYELNQEEVLHYLNTLEESLNK